MALAMFDTASRFGENAAWRLKAFLEEKLCFRYLSPQHQTAGPAAVGTLALAGPCRCQCRFQSAFAQDYPAALTTIDESLMVSQDTGSELV
ncbi:hypothetical protein [Devosia ginsengisoli]|uniref:Uncharacterized protein n=1 Tax=Devosia ginsengisoli TaxID=400770 RepID=A0A5B8LQ40_9HYPH|nr:hypothetical protein [Devosia ginsengisoli]QDZ09290.1 hypothetical protein FPZ08_00040 [Devosia ginsengisoli]